MLHFQCVSCELFGCDGSIVVLPFNAAVSPAAGELLQIIASTGGINGFVGFVFDF